MRDATQSNPPPTSLPPQDAHTVAPPPGVSVAPHDGQLDGAATEPGIARRNVQYSENARGAVLLPPTTLPAASSVQSSARAKMRTVIDS